MGISLTLHLNYFLPPSLFSGRIQTLYNSIKNEKLEWAM